MIKAPSLPIFQATLPLPPGLNASYKIVNFKTQDDRWIRRPGATPELEAFKYEAHLKLNMQRGEQDWNIINALGAQKKHIPLAISIDFYYPTMWKHDIDSGEKAVIDAIFTHIGLNDNLITDKHTRKRADRDNPRCEIAISLEQE
jgi:Holliday junction resolvase RusA-like endonuclease